MSGELQAVEASDEFDLRHYASKYYDPAKAREYYLKTRELEGRTASTEKLSKESREKQSEAKSYVRNQVSTERTAVREAATAEQKARLDGLRDEATATRERIRANVKKFRDAVLSAADAVSEQVNTKVERAVRKAPELIVIEPDEVPEPNLNKIPTSASPKLRAFLEKQNGRIMTAYNGKVKKAETKAKDATRKANKEANDKADAQFQKDSAREDADQEKVDAEVAKANKGQEKARADAKALSLTGRESLKEVGMDLKDAVTKARTEYTTAREAIAAKYSTDLKTELQNIEDKVR